MKIILPTILSFIFTNSIAQSQNKVAIYFEPAFTKTITDATKANNQQAVGIGLTTIFNNKSQFSPIITISDDFAFLDDKVFRIYNGDGLKPITNVLNVFVGANYNPTKNFYISVAAGPSFINNQTLFGIKPSIGFYFPQNKSWIIKLSYTNIFNRNAGITANYTALSFSVGIKLF